MNEIDEKGGYDVEFVGNEPHNVTCCICLLVLREPMQAEQCGHRFCESCVGDLKNSQNGTIVCPEDRQVINVFKDRGRKREILNLIVKCSNHQGGCTANPELRGLKDHLKNCEFQLIQCPFKNCNTQLQRDSLAKHKMERHNEDRFDLLETKFEQAMQRIEDLSQENQSKTQEIKQAMQSIEGFSRENQLKTQKFEQTVQRIKDLELENQSKAQKFEQAMQRIEGLERENKSKTQEVKQAMQSIEGLSQENQSKTQEIDGLKETINALEDKVCNQIFYSSYVWKVNQFTRKFRRAQQDKTCDPQARTFFTTKGYRIKSELYLNGNDDGWNKTMTIYFVLEPGPFDDTLKWPMSAVITSSLLFNGNVMHQGSLNTKTLPNENRNVYQRPKKLGGASLGAYIVDVNELNKYCIDDIITLKIDISY